MRRMHAYVKTKLHRQSVGAYIVRAVELTPVQNEEDLSFASFVDLIDDGDKHSRRLILLLITVRI